MARRLLGPVAEVGRPLAEVMALQDQESCDWYATNKPYDGLGSRVGLTEQAWFTIDGDRGSRHRPDQPVLPRPAPSRASHS